ncbi:MAG: helix-turn-helix transcriptional regulator [Clostridiales bacterium]|nr:helix-turn-helix transcriptional regulator [Clostridiales bacterium]
MTYESFLKKLKEIRIRKDVSAEELSSHLGKTRQQYYMIESGRCPLRMRDYFLLCEKLGVSLTELLYSEEENTSFALLNEAMARLSVRDAQIIKSLIILME